MLATLNMEYNFPWDIFDSYCWISSWHFTNSTFFSCYRKIRYYVFIFIIIISCFIIGRIIVMHCEEQYNILSFLWGTWSDSHIFLEVEKRRIHFAIFSCYKRWWYLPIIFYKLFQREKYFLVINLLKGACYNSCL